jgi:phytoene synthase
MTGAVAEARAAIAAGSKSFALASRILPAQARDRVVVLYAFCRQVDDAIDLARPEERPSALAQMERELDSIYRHECEGKSPLLRAFAEVVRDRRIPRRYPAELLAGMRMDVSGHHYTTLDDLLHYCFRVAGTVGLMMCHALGVSDEAALRNAAHLGIAMQLTNICRDVHEDWQRGRLYVPDDVLADCGLGALPARLGAPFPGEAREPMKRAVAGLLAEAEHYYASGAAGFCALPWRAALAVRSAGLMYSAIGDRVKAQDCDILGRRAVVPSRDKAKLIVMATCAALGEVPSRLGRAGAPKPHTPASVVRFPHDVLPIPRHRRSPAPRPPSSSQVPRGEGGAQAGHDRGPPERIPPGARNLGGTWGTSY